METKIELNECTCSRCERKIENNSPVVHSTRNFNENFCYDCGRYDYYESMGKNKNTDYLIYHLKNGFGKLSVNDDIFELIPKGVYELKFRKGEHQEYFYIESELGEEERAFEYLRTVDDDSYILEIKDANMWIFFPDNKVQDIYDFYDNQDDYNDIIYRFKKWTSQDSFYYICFSNKIYGLSLKNLPHYRSRVLSAREMSSFRLETADDIKKFYIGNAIGRYMATSLEKLTPAKMLEYCQDRIQGQGIELKKAVYKIFRYIQSVAKAEPFQAENWLLTSPSGTGKTEFYRTIRDLFKDYNIPIPVVQIDLSQITESGFKGANVSTIPQRILSEKSATGGIGICFLDEADKKCVPSYGSHGVNYNAAIQANLLTLLEGIETDVDVDGDEQKFDSGKTMFVLIGSFQELRDKKQEEEMNSKKIGFCRDGDVPDKVEVFYEDLTLEDIVDFGMQEELAGRLVSIVNFHKLDEEDMIKLLRKKTEIISKELDCSIELKEAAERELLDLSFGNLGVRLPMNIIRTLAQNTIADVFFDRGFDYETDKVVIDSAESAHIETFREPDIPNAGTIRAFEEVDELMKDPYKKTYNSFEEMMKDIDD